MTDSIKMAWESRVLKTINKLKAELKNDAKVMKVPKGKLCEFSSELALGIFLLLEADSKGQLANEWIEKVRKYAEINRPQLLAVSNKRFGDAGSAFEALEAMAILMALTSFTKASIIHFNATCTIWNAVKKRYGDKECEMKSSLRLIAEIVNNPKYFVGKKYEI